MLKGRKWRKTHYQRLITTFAIVISPFFSFSYFIFIVVFNSAVMVQNLWKRVEKSFVTVEKKGNEMLNFLNEFGKEKKQKVFPRFRFIRALQMLSYKHYFYGYQFVYLFFYRSCYLLGERLICTCRWVFSMRVEGKKKYHVVSFLWDR